MGKKARKYKCVCCGKYTMPEPTPGSYNVCLECGWEDDKAQYNNPDLEGGANELSLNEYREKYLNKLEAENPALRPHKTLCENVGICGGCAIQEYKYEEQLKKKEKAIKKLFSKWLVGEEAPEEKTASSEETSSEKNVAAVEKGEEIIAEDTHTAVYEGIIPSPDEFDYRNKMEFTFGDEMKGGELTLGMHKKRSFHDIIDMKECKIVNEDCMKIVRTIIELSREYKLPHENKRTHEGYLRHLVLRTGNANGGEIMVNLVTKSEYSTRVVEIIENPEEKDKKKRRIVNEILTPGGKEAEKKYLDEMVERILKLSLERKVVSIVHTINDSFADAVKCDRLDVLYGRDYIENELLGLKFKVSPFSFFQTNTEGAAVLYRKVQEYAGDVSGKAVYDLYSGTGTITQIVSQVAKKAVGVEIIEEAVEAAKENAKLNNLDNCEFIAGDVFKVLSEVEEKEGLPDMVILDPPREGVNPKALPRIIGYGVEKIVYVSCKPESLARDLETFWENGYKPVKMCNVDMFPQTEHVETVVLMSKVKE